MKRKNEGASVRKGRREVVASSTCYTFHYFFSTTNQHVSRVHLRAQSPNPATPPLLPPLLPFSSRKVSYGARRRVCRLSSNFPTPVLFSPSHSIPETRYLIDHREIGTNDPFKRQENQRARLFLMTSTRASYVLARGSISRVYRKNVRTRTY